jgi:hypothetical protein
LPLPFGAIPGETGLRSTRHLHYVRIAIEGKTKTWGKTIIDRCHELSEWVDIPIMLYSAPLQNGN